MGEGHHAWTADDAHVAALADDQLLVYADTEDAIVVTTNRDCATTARRILVSTIYLAVIEANALAAAEQALFWLTEHPLPEGRVLKVRKTVPPVLMTPIAW